MPRLCYTQKSKKLNVNEVIEHVEQINKKIDEIRSLQLNRKEGAHVYQDTNIKFINPKKELQILLSFLMILKI